METAHAFSRLATELQLTPEQIGQRTGKDRSTVINFLRLLGLADDLQQLVAENRLSAGHARCLLSLPTLALQREVAEKAIAGDWSVRQTERTTQKMMADRQPKHVTMKCRSDLNVKAAIQELQRAARYFASKSSKKPKKAAKSRSNTIHRKIWTESTR